MGNRLIYLRDNFLSEIKIFSCKIISSAGHNKNGYKDKAEERR